MLPELREAVWRRAEGRCERVVGGRRCGRPVDRANWEGHVHHLVYRGHGLERAEDLLLFCLACHGIEHPHRTFLTKAEQLARRDARRARRIGRAPVDAMAGLTLRERRALSRGAGSWAWRPPE